MFSELYWGLGVAKYADKYPSRFGWVANYLVMWNVRKKPEFLPHLFTLLQHPWLKSTDWDGFEFVWNDLKWSQIIYNCFEMAWNGLKWFQIISNHFECLKWFLIIRNHLKWFQIILKWYATKRNQEANVRFLSGPFERRRHEKTFFVFSGQVGHHRTQQNRMNETESTRRLGGQTCD